MTDTAALPPIIFACAGCSEAGRVAYDVGRELDRRGAGEMSCLAGVAAGKPHFLKKLAGRTAWVIDGCPIGCAAGVLEKANAGEVRVIELQEFGVRKQSGMDEAADLGALVDAVTEHFAGPPKSK